MNREWTTELRETSALVDPAEVDRRKAERLRQCGESACGSVIVARGKDRPTAAAYVGCSGEDGGWKRVERFDQPGSRHQPGDDIARCPPIQIGGRKIAEVDGVGGIDDDPALPIAHASYSIGYG